MIGTTSSRWPYSGDASNDTFAYTNRIDESSWLNVFVDDTAQVLDTDFTVTGVGEENGGSVIFTTPPPAGTLNVVIVRATPETQEVGLPFEGPFPSSVIERNALDKLCMMIQDLRGTFGTSVAGEFIRWDSIAQSLVVGEPDSGLIERFDAVVVGAGSMYVDINLSTAEPDTNYAPGVVASNWSTTWSIPDANKTTTQFRVAFDVAAPSGGKIWVRVYSAA